MKKIVFLLMCFLASTFISAQNNFEISTMRIGPFHLKMEVSEAEKMAGSPLQDFHDYEKPNNIKFRGEPVSIRIYEDKDQNNIIARSMATISTTSPKFKTKRGVGVGSSRNEVIEAYKDFPNFSVFQAWDEDGKSKSDETYIHLEDRDAHTLLQFHLINNKVKEITVLYNEGCC